MTHTCNAPGCPPYPCEKWQHIWPGVPLIQNTTIIQQPVDLQTLTPRYTEQAVSFLEQNVRNPFFLELAYDEAHVPLFASAEFRNTSLRGFYGDAMQEMDASIGTVLAKIKDLGLDDNTLVFFTSDNGPWLGQELAGGSAGMFRGGKGETWEGGFREPAIARWPGKIAPGTVSMEVASSMDLLPTFFSLANVSVPTDRVIDGHDISDILFGNGKSKTENYFFYRQKTLHAVRHGAFKAHYVTRSGFGADAPVTHDPPLLFNVEQDPGEQYELDASTHADVLAAIAQVVADHKANMVEGAPTLDKQSLSVMPCCNKAAGQCFCNNVSRSNEPMDIFRLADHGSPYDMLNHFTVIAK